jgi:hypothetical protein|tara:strand:+ start:50 stop:364 length:315 start_codon:yes stop_codon:yes gene_type:complete
MKGKKIVFGLAILSFLSACTSPTAMLGPAYTLSTTGNVLQASLSYGSNQMITTYTGKTPLENIKGIALTNKKNVKKDTLESKEFYNLVKKNIEEANKIIQSINQ